KIRELENTLKRAQVIKEEGKKNVVSLGRTVVMREVGTDFDETYTIVGSLEADPVNGRISNESPIGKALLGKKVGNKVKVESPGGEIEFQIVKIE
ncbi:MAG: GreA/GreB family elongation factor, partial [Caldilineaceae bacterium]|nr:GreA/GreB family elongation factor [Caldilineaceae bacterium]